MKFLSILFAALVLLSLSSCGLMGPKIEGTFKKKVYQAPNKAFSIPQPKLIWDGFGDTVQDSVEGESGVVSFSDSFGNLVRVVYQKLDPGAPFWPGEGGVEPALSQFQEHFLGVVEQSGIEISEVRQEDATVGGRDALYLEFLGKGASHVGPADWLGRQKSRFDAVIGNMTFIEGEYLYHVSRHWSDLSVLSDEDKADERTPEEKAEQMATWRLQKVQQLKELAESMTFPARQPAFME